MLVNERIKKVRKSLKLTLKEFSSRVKVPLTTVSKYEKGIVKPSFDVLANIGKVYKVNLNWLLTGKGEIFLTPKPPESASPKDGDLYNKDKRIQELENEVNLLKKSIQKLDEENKELNTELMDKMRKLLGLQEKLILT